MSRQGRWEYLKAIHARYRQAPRAEKGRILGEFCGVTGHHRKSVLRLLNSPPPWNLGRGIRAVASQVSF